MALRSNIGDLIKNSGLKKSFIAKKLNITTQQLRNYERGLSLIPIDKGYLLADLLSKQIGDLYEWSKDDTE
jgi:transcriptional regulator with XRE-family HTH domain